MRSIAIFVSVWCLCVCLSVSWHISKTTIGNFTKFPVHVMWWPWLGPLLTTTQYVTYFWFCGRRILTHNGFQLVKTTEVIPRHTYNFVSARRFTNIHQVAPPYCSNRGTKSAPFCGQWRAESTELPASGIAANDADFWRRCRRSFRMTA